ncbi:MAG: 6-phosphogluconolactonase [Nitrospiraceae bacterium]|nr:6-phosphogluconolactonase [Nitrospiraceae bacterium]
MKIEAGRYRVWVFENAEKMADFAAGKWGELSSQAVEEKGVFAAALSGGTTPVGFYERLSRLEGLPWDKTHIFLADERFVPYDSPDSNFGMIKATLLDHVSIPENNLHPVRTDLPDPQAAARDYEGRIKEFFHLPEGVVFPSFDLITLGIGEDGHTASIFPGSVLLKHSRHIAASAARGEHAFSHDRVTLTVQTINKAKNVIFLVSGDKKASVLRDVVEKQCETLPASLVKPGGNLYYLADSAAGSGILGEKTE